MFTTSALKNMPYAQAKIRRGTNYVSLVSYSTTVIEITDNTLRVYGLYSATTRRHISAFMREIGLDYSIAKKCVKNGLYYSLTANSFIEPFTGEVVE